MNHIIIAQNKHFTKLIHDCKEILLRGDKVVLISDNGKSYSFHIKERLYNPAKDEWTFLTLGTGGIDVEHIAKEYIK